MKKLFLATAIIVLSLTIRAQDYFPLQVGNVWYLDSGPNKIIAERVIDNKTYFQFIDSSLHRIDELGNVLLRINDSTEFIQYKLKADTGEVWQEKLNWGGFNIIRFTKLESKNDIIKTNDTTFENCYRYSITYLNVFDADYKVWLAKDIGIVQTVSMGWGMDSTFLLKAIVNGKRIPSRIIPPEITKVLPLHGQTSVPVDVQLAVYFNLRIRNDLVNKDNIKIVSAKDGLVDYHFDGSFERPDIRFTPDEPLEYDDVITVTLSKALADYMDDHLSADYVFKFYTESKVQDPMIFSRDTLSAISNLSWGDFDFADYDKDGDIDLILAGVVDTVDSGMKPKVELYENSAGEFFRKDTSFNAVRTDMGKDCIKWLDFDNDGYADFVFSGKDKNFQPVTQFYRNLGNSFALVPEMNLNFGAAQMNWFDFNKDGYEDLAISGNTEPKTFDIVLYKNDKGKLSKYTSLKLDSYHPGIHRWVDFNSDGEMDIIKTGNKLSDTKFFENKAGIFSLADIQVEMNKDYWLPYHYNIDYSDIDKDGDQDIIIGSKLLIKQNNKFTSEDDQIDDFNNTFVSFDDFDYDGWDDLFLIGDKPDNIGRSRTYIQLYKGVGGNFSLYKEVRFEKYIFLFSARWLDLNNDKKTDLAAMTSDGFLIYYNIMNTSSVNINKPVYDFSLQQNYPNPFNPVTKIQYTIPVNGQVKIIIFDILGKEIAMILNEEKPSGNYEISFDAAKYNLTSGVYFYNIQFSSGKELFSDTIKLVLVK